MATVQDIQKQVTTRLREIAAEVAALEKERTALNKVADTLGSSGPSAPARNGRRRTARRRTAAARAAAGARATRGARAAAASTTATTRARRQTRARRGAGSGGKRSEQTVQIIGQRPGITVKEIAAELGIKPNYLYRVLPALEKDGKVTKRGTGYVPAASS